MMKFLPIVPILLLISFAGSVLAETDSACVRNAGGAVITAAHDTNMVTDVNGNNGLACKEAPDFYRIKFYRFGMCKSNPLLNAINDFSNCSYLVDSDAGVSHVLSYPSTAVLDTNSAIAPGTYSHLLLILNNGLEQMHTETFSRTMTGTTGTGTTCWTVNKKTTYGGNTLAGTVAPDISDRNTLAMECGATAAAAYTTEIFDTMGCGSPPCFNASDISAQAHVELLTSDNVTIATTAVNAVRIAVVMPLAKTILADSTFDIGFKVVGSTSVDLAHASGTTYVKKVGADPFQVTLTVK